MVTIYCDGADIATMTKYAIDPVVGGFTTNPSLMKKSGIKNYRDFAQAVLSAIGDKPVSFEVLADDWDEMETQAHEIASWGENVWVKIPIMNTKGESSIDLIDKLQDLRLNITAVMTLEQLALLRDVDRSHHIVSVFAGRIADTGQNPWGIVARASEGRAKVLWASARQVLDVWTAERCGASIITLTPDLISKLSLHGKDLHQYSLETVRQFYEDGKGLCL